ncbi:MAG: sigma-54 dependent transcriptional regulator [bacterium]|nr:sigma-54 dependent transcriptional regulator [bacterium]
MTGPDDDIRLSILLIDDDSDSRRTLRQFLEVRHHRVFEAGCGEDGLAFLRREAVDVVMTDLKMPGMDGFEVVRRVREMAPDTETIIITGYGDMDGAVQALREGAFDFFSKPIDMQGLTATLQRTARFHALRMERNRYRDRLADLSAEGRQLYGLSAMVGEGAAIRAVKQQIREVAETEATTVLISGETGTGKELVARAIHYESRRSEGPFVAVDCTAIPEALVESELYGHVKGAFTDAREERKGRFEQADGGTIFLDEIGDMALSMQARLLRALEERRMMPVGGSREVPVDVRVVSATNKDLPRAIARGGFRQDLYYRLNTVHIHVPALRERGEDISILAAHFLAQFSRELRRPLKGFTQEALDALSRHGFPGNIRELSNLMEQAVIFCRGEEVTVADLNFARSSEQASEPEAAGEAGLRRVADPEDLNLAVFEEKAIREALRRCAGNQHQAAELLGISRFAIKRRMGGYGIE